MTEQHRNPVAEYVEAVERLTRPHLVTVDAPPPQRASRLEAPLLHTLARMCASGVTRGSGASADPHARAPLNIGAADLLHAIRRTVLAAYAERVGGDARPDVVPALLELRLAIINAHRAGKITTHALDAATAQADGWARAITDLLDPPKRIEVTAPCPRCGERWLDPEPDTEGDVVPALVTTYREVADAVTECAACHASWSGIDGARRLRLELDATERMRALLLGA